MSRPAVDADAAEPTPEPGSTGTRAAPDDEADGHPPLVVYFADPTPEMLAAEAAIGAAYEEARGLYGDEDGDAWLAALEDGTHPLCRVKTAA